MPQSSTSSSLSPLPRRVSSPFKPPVPRNNYPTSCSSFSSPPSSRSSSNNSTPFTSPNTTSASITFHLPNAQNPETQPANDPSTQDFEFDDLFTFNSHSITASSQQKSSSLVGGSSKRTSAPILTPSPQPQRRHWSKFSFSHYKPPEPTINTTTTHRPKPLEPPRPPPGPNYGSKGHSR